MALVVKKLETDLKSLIDESAKKAMKKTFAVDGSNGLTTSQLQTKVSNNFGSEFAKELAPQLASIIDSYIKSITLVPKLTAPNGAVIGTIGIT